MPHVDDHQILKIKLHHARNFTLLMNAVKEYKVLDEHRIWLRFSDGFESIVNLRPLLNKGIAVELIEPAEFSKVAIESGGGLAWDNGFDICPNSLRELAERKVHVA